MRQLYGCYLVASLLSLAQAPSAQQSVVVDTVVPAGSEIDDGLTFGPDGALYGSRWGPSAATPGRTVTRVDLATGALSLYTDGLRNANGLGFDAAGDLFVVSWGGRQVHRVTPDGMQTVHASVPAGNPSGLLLHPQTGVLYVTNATTNTVDIVQPDGTVTPFLVNDGEAPELNAPVGLAVDDAGQLYVSNFSDGKILRVEASGDLTEIADLQGPLGFTTGYITYAAGSLFATGIGTHVIEEVDLATGDVRVLAGTGTAGTEDGPGETARFNGPNGIVATVTGDTLYVSGFNSRAVRRIIRTRGTAAESTPGASARSHLLPAFPNPTTGAAVVRFRLGRSEHIALTLHDALGREVAALAEGEWAAGLHAVSAGLEALAGGVYLVRLETSSVSESRVLSVVR